MLIPLDAITQIHFPIRPTPTVGRKIMPGLVRGLGNRMLCGPEHRVHQRPLWADFGCPYLEEAGFPVGTKPWSIAFRSLACAWAFCNVVCLACMAFGVFTE